MATIIKTLRQGEDQVLPRTVSQAVTMPDGTNLDHAIENIDINNVKVQGDTAEQLGVIEGTSLSQYLVNQRNDVANTLASAEVID